MIVSVVFSNLPQSNIERLDNVLFCGILEQSPRGSVTQEQHVLPCQMILRDSARQVL